MLLAALLYAYAWLVLLAAGMIVCKLLTRFFSFEILHPALWLVLGMAGLTAFISILHLWLPIGLWMHVITLAFLFVSLVFQWSWYKQLCITGYTHVKSTLPFLLLLSAIAIISITGRTGSGDIADYHLQGIKWAEYFPNVKGLGNFNKPLANNYWWFNLQAFFGLHFLGVQSVYVMNAVLYSCVVFYLIDQFKLQKYNWFVAIVLLFLALNISTAFIGAVTPDVCINYLIVMCFALMLLHGNEPIYTAILLMLFAFAITVKLTAIMLMALPIIILFHQYQQIISNTKKWLLLAFTIFVLFGLPWIAGNVIQSGYIIPLYTQLDVFDIDWKVPASIIEKERELITIWSRVPTQDITITKQLTSAQWLPQWFAGYDMANRGTIIIALLSILFLAFKSMMAITGKKYSYQTGLHLAAILGLIMLFAGSPQLRFMFGFIWVIIAFATQTILSSIKFPARLFQFSIIGIMLVLACLKVISLQRKHGIENILLIPPPYPKPEVKKVTSRNIIYYTTPFNNTCWDQFPCSYYMLEGTVMRGEDLEDGFRNGE